jgi:hypothetical protein
MAYAILGKIYTTIFYFSTRGFGLPDILSLHLPKVIILSIAMVGVYYLISKRKLELSLGGKTFLLIFMVMAIIGVLLKKSS